MKRIHLLMSCFALLYHTSMGSNTSHAGLPHEASADVFIQVSRMAEVGIQLSKLFRIPVSVEEARGCPRPEDNNALIEILDFRREQGVRIQASNATLRAVMDDLITRYPEYQWTIDQGTGIVNLFPVESAPAQWITNPLDLSDQSVESILEEHDRLGLKDRGIYFYSGRGNPLWMQTRVVTVQQQEASCRSVLNQISSQLDPPRVWVMKELDKPSALWDQTGRVVTYELRFYALPPTK